VITAVPHSAETIARPAVTKTDLIDRVAQAIQVPRTEAALIVESILDGMVHALEMGDKVEVRGFGSFHTRPRRARISRNPRTGASVKVPARSIPYFKASKELRELIQGSSGDGCASERVL
jgi:integration host factor subunit beta